MCITDSVFVRPACLHACVCSAGPRASYLKRLADREGAAEQNALLYKQCRVDEE